MFRNYLVTALRNLKRNKVYTILNVVGLALGIGCALVIFKVIRYETSFESHHGQFDHIYRIVHENIYPDRIDKGQGTPHPLGPALRQDFPELEFVVRTHYDYGAQININENGEFKKFMFEEGIAFVEPSYFNVFTVKWIAGDAESSLTDPQTAVISQSMAGRLFGLQGDQASNAIGRIINYNNKEDFKVVGVIEDPPETTNFPFHLLFEYHSAQLKINPYYGEGKRWNSTSSNTNTYIIPVDKTGFDQLAFEERLVQLVEKYRGEGESENIRYLAQPLADVHFNEEYGNNQGTTSVEFLVALGIIGLFLIVTACINFINLATAQAANRAKEIGIRKAIGGISSQLVVQFFSEIAIITFLAMLLSFAIAEIMFVSLEDLMGYRLSLDLFMDQHTLLFLTVLFVSVSLLSGFYPSILLAKMNTVMALRNKISTRHHSGGLSLRKGLVIVQFAITQFLIIGTLIVSAQMEYFSKKDLGFKTDAIVTTYTPDNSEVKRERFRKAMMASSTISDVTFSLSQPTGNSNSHSDFNYAPLESEMSYNGNFKPIDERFIDFYDIKMLAGRATRVWDTSNVVINRKIADLMGFSGNYPAAIGAKLNTGWNGDKTIVGVCENFHIYSLNENLDYVIFFYWPQAFYSLSFKIASTQNIDDGLAHFRKSWESIFPEYVVDYSFYDEEIAERYEYEQNISTLMRIFSVISILIGCLGLYGLIAFIALNKTKEIGVRKVLGASVFNILGIFSKEIIILISVAFVIAAPLGFFAMKSWLQDYAFRIPIGFNFFGWAFILTLLIAMITISHRTLTSATINPALTLKDE